MVTISVILPTQNRAEMLPRSVKSVLSQTYKNLELTIVDDGSTDNTDEVIASFQDPRIRTIRHRKARGASAARNTGIANSKGEFVAFLDDDDEWLPMKLEKQERLLTQAPKTVGLIYCWMDYFKGNRLVGEHHPELRGHVFPQVLDRQRLGGCPTLLVRREVLHEVGGFDESLPRGNDGDFIRRVCRCYEVDYVPEALVRVHIGHSGRISENTTQGLKNAISGGESKLRKFGQELKSFPDVHATILLQLAVRCQALGKTRRALLYVWRAARVGGCAIEVCRTGVNIVMKLMRNRLRKVTSHPYHRLREFTLSLMKAICRTCRYVLGVKLPILRRHLNENWAVLRRVRGSSDTSRLRVVYMTGMPRTGTSLAKNYMGTHRGLEVIRFQPYGFVRAWQCSKKTDQIVVDKATHYIHNVCKIYRAYGRSVAFYCLVRDPRDELASLLETDKHPEIFRDQRFWKQWAKTYESYLEFASCQSQPGLCYLIRYEDLVRWPVAAKIHFLKWLGITPDSETITPDYGIIYEDDTQDWKVRDRQRISTDSIGRWKRTPWQRQCLVFTGWKRMEKVASMMEVFGYNEKRCSRWCQNMNGITVFRPERLWQGR